MLLIFLFFLCITGAKAFNLGSRRQKSILKIVTSASVGLSLIGAPVIAADSSEALEQSQPRMVMTMDSPVAKKSTKDAVDEDGDESYLSSLQREKRKQEEQKKKSKVSRGKDLCEALGRGC
jgi:hypothetical protein